MRFTRVGMLLEAECRRWRHAASALSRVSLAAAAAVLSLIVTDQVRGRKDAGRGE